MKKIINAATIGLGFGLLHAKIFKENKNTKLICISDINKKKKIYAKQLKTKFVNNSKYVFEDKNINLVSIATYDNFHFKNILTAIERKKNIFVEKPLCQNIKQLKKIKKLLKKSKLKLSSNFVLRYHPKFKKVKEIVSRNIIGKIYSIEGEYNYGRLEKLLKGWRGRLPYYSIAQGGGIHIIDLMIWLTNSIPTKTISLGNKFNSKILNYKFNDNNIALLKFKNGTIGKVTSNFSCVMPHNHYLKIYGTKGTIEVNFDKILLFKSRKKNSRPINVKYKNNKNYKKELLNLFLDCLRNNKKPTNPSIENIYSSLLTCFAIDKSIKTKIWEKIKI